MTANSPKRKASRTADATYAAAGVDQRREDAVFDKMSEFFCETVRARDNRLGAVKLPFGYFANVVDIDGKTGIAIATDSVGTKALIAQAAGRFDTIGIDCVASNVNDILCVGAEPLSFVDYIGVAKIEPSVLLELAKGLADGAREADISICGGEIAQVGALLRGQVRRHVFDIVGTCIGHVPLDRIVTGADVQPGDLVLGLPSTGLHCNGVSLARNVLTRRPGWSLDSYIEDLGMKLVDELLRPTRIYTTEVLTLLKAGVIVHGLIHISGKGLLNLGRNAARVSYLIDQFPEPAPIFSLVREIGKIPHEVMFTVFNMGIGFCIIVPPDSLDLALRHLRSLGSSAALLGTVISGDDCRVVLDQYGIVGYDGAFRPL